MREACQMHSYGEQTMNHALVVSTMQEVRRSRQNAKARQETSPVTKLSSGRADRAKARFPTAPFVRRKSMVTLQIGVLAADFKVEGESKDVRRHHGNLNRFCVSADITPTRPIDDRIGGST